MSSSRLAAGVFVLSAASASAAVHVNCPATLMTADGTLHALSDARIFLGPVAKKVEIVPIQGNFDVGQIQGTGDGEVVNLVCDYEKTTRTQTLEVPRTATTCDVADAGAGTVAGCH